MLQEQSNKRYDICTIITQLKKIRQPEPPPMDDFAPIKETYSFLL